MIKTINRMRKCAWCGITVHTVIMRQPTQGRGLCCSKKCAKAIDASYVAARGHRIAK